MRILSLLLAFLFLSSGRSTGQSPVAPVEPERDWTFLVYMCADNDLEFDSITDFFEMVRAGSSEDVNIVVQYDRHYAYDRRHGDWADTRRFHIQRGMTPDPGEELEILGEVNMGRGLRQAEGDGSLEDFVRWGMTRFPSRRTALILWDHGDGWSFANSHIPPYKGIGEDWTDHDVLRMKELRTALESAAADGHRLDLLGFDACLMGMLEVAHEVHELADVMVASERFEWSSGWPYKRILAALNRQPHMSAAELGSVIVSRYAVAEPGMTMSSIDLEAVPGLTRSVDDLALKMIERRGEIAAVRAAVRQYDSFDGFKHIDLGDMLDLLQQEIEHGPIHDASGAASAALAEAVLDWTPRDQRDNGLAIYFPKVAIKLDAAYNSNRITFARDGHWDEFLRWYHGYKQLYVVGEGCPEGRIELRITAPEGTSPLAVGIGSAVLDPPLPTPWGGWCLDSPLLRTIVLEPMPAGGIRVLPIDLPPLTPAPWDMPVQAFVGDRLTGVRLVPIR